ncbi:MAG TPA: D-alanyl-D-alanine carboxypeptidase/D-alanyl-D-alanine-endopeptidase [bacterium]|nr:D-alanyl-D-alanine carboxypeptidase/D-alanyl-D-alanine-endopeptidase [bacterium]
MIVFRNLRGSILFVVTLILLVGCAGASRSVEQKPAGLEALIEPYLQHPALVNATVGIFIQEPETRRVIYRKNAHTLFMPASNQKLITTAAALSELGPDFRFRTQIYRDGSIDNGVLRGNLYIRGTGDPTLSGRFHDGETLRDLRNWADSLQAAGISRITGDIIADANLFDDRRLGNGWEHNDLSYWYAAEISALSFNDNCLNVRITPADSIGAPAHLKYEPNTGYVEVTNHLVTTHQDSITHYDYHRTPGTNRIRFYGNISQGETGITDWVTVHNPAMFTATVFAELLKQSGIILDGSVREIQYEAGQIPEYDSPDRLIDYPSPPLSEIIRVINRRSQNFYAEQLLKRLGYEITGKGSFRGGIRAVNGFLAEIGVDTEHLNIADGSGLSRRNLVSPFQLVTVLRHMYESKYRDQYLSSLPVGAENGTLEERLLSPYAANKVRAKTGYVGFVRTLSGCVRTLDERMLVFSILVNHYVTNTGVVNELQDTILTLITSHSYQDLIPGAD